MGIYGSERYDLPDRGQPMVQVDGTWTNAMPESSSPLVQQYTLGQGTPNQTQVERYNIPSQAPMPEQKGMEQRLIENQPPGGYKSIPEYNKALIEQLHQTAKEQGHDLNTQEGNDWYKNNYQHGMETAQSYINPASVKDLKELGDGTVIDGHGNVVYSARGQKGVGQQPQPQGSAPSLDLSLPSSNLSMQSGQGYEISPQQVPPVYNRQVPFKQPEPTTSERQRAEAQDVLDNYPIGNSKYKAAQEVLKQLDYQDRLKQKDENAKLEGLSGSVEGDVKDILEGRNTMYNVRQTMGRSNKAAKYMEDIRSKVRDYDPKFDFVASDAGGKSVSSPYVQRSMAAVNSVLPNIEKITELSKDVDRIGIKGIDELLQKGAVQFGNKKVANFRQARKLLADEIGAALGAGSASDMKLQLGFDVTDTSVPDEVFASNMGIVREFIQNRKDGLNSLRYKSGQGEETNVPRGTNAQSIPTPPSPAPAGQVWLHNLKTGEWKLKAK